MILPRPRSALDRQRTQAARNARLRHRRSAQLKETHRQITAEREHIDRRPSSRVHFSVTAFFLFAVVRLAFVHCYLTACDELIDGVCVCFEKKTNLFFFIAFRAPISLRKSRTFLDMTTVFSSAEMQIRTLHDGSNDENSENEVIHWQSRSRDANGYVLRSSAVVHCDACVCLEELTELFSAFGPVLEASVIKDYGFVVMRRARGSATLSILRFFSRSTSVASKRRRRPFLA